MNVTRDLLADLANEIWELAERWVPAVNAAKSAAVAPAILGAYIYAQLVQGGLGPEAFHLPEPLLQPIERPAVLVVGLNPGFGGSEIIPTLSWPRTLAIEWYATRFNADRRDPNTGCPTARYAEHGQEYVRVVPHYQKVERLLAPVLGAQSLGRRAVYCDAIPWKFNNPTGRNRGLRPQMTSAEWRGAWTAARARIGQISRALQPSVIVTLGKEPAAKALPNDWAEGHVAAPHPARWWTNGAKPQDEYAYVHEQITRILSRS